MADMSHGRHRHDSWCFRAYSSLFSEITVMPITQRPYPNLAWIACLLAFFACADFFVAMPDARAGDFRAANASEVREIRNKIRAAQFLSKATFGPTEDAIATLATRITQRGYLGACEEWIDTQFALPATSHEQTAYDIIAVDGRSFDTSQ